jgi:hypothetical protein
MQAVKIILPGKFWDSQIYMGRLYLFGLEGDLTVLNWDLLSDELNISEYLHYVFLASFVKGDELYSLQNRELLNDIEIKAVLQKKFVDLTDSHIEINRSNLEKLTIWHDISPFPFPHSDSLIYGKNLYTVGISGLFYARCGTGRNKPISTKSKRLWDSPILNATASYFNIALAAGDEGLYELGVGDYSNTEPRSITKKNCNKCDWNYFSIYCSSDVGTSYLASYSDIRGSGINLEDSEQWRRFDRTIDAAEIFGSQGYSLGAKDKIYLIEENNVEVVRYNPWKKISGQQPLFERIGTIHLDSWKGMVVSADVASFGLVIECENAMVVIPSVGNPITIPGQPVNWRIFPRSIYYENQLHIIYEDRMEILSFSHDYFVDQRAKLAGYINTSDRSMSIRRSK